MEKTETTLKIWTSPNLTDVLASVKVQYSLWIIAGEHGQVLHFKFLIQNFTQMMPIK